LANLLGDVGHGANNAGSPRPGSIRRGSIAGPFTVFQDRRYRPVEPAPYESSISAMTGCVLLSSAERLAH
jgi:hypothetical protein